MRKKIRQPRHNIWNPLGLDKLKPPNKWKSTWKQRIRNAYISMPSGVEHSYSVAAVSRRNLFNIFKTPSIHIPANIKRIKSFWWTFHNTPIIDGFIFLHSWAHSWSSSEFNNSALRGRISDGMSSLSIGLFDPIRSIGFMKLRKVINLVSVAYFIDLRYYH